MPEKKAAKKKTTRKKMPEKKATRKKPQGEEPPVADELSLSEEIAIYVSQMDSLHSAFFATMVALAERAMKKDKELKRYIRDKHIEKRLVDGGTDYRLRPQHFAGFKKLNRDFVKSMDAIESIPITFFVALVCRYDAYLGRLLGVILRKKPE